MGVVCVCDAGVCEGEAEVECGVWMTCDETPVLQCVAVCCGVLQWGAVCCRGASGGRGRKLLCCRVLLCVAAEVEELLRGKYDALLARMEVCCNVLRCVAQLLQCAAVCYRVLQCLTLLMKMDVCNDTSHAPCVL